MSDLSPALSAPAAPELAPVLGKEPSTWDTLPGLVTPIPKGPRCIPVVVLAGTDIGWYGTRGPRAYLPLDEYIRHFGQPDLTEMVTQRISHHWDSGWPDEYRQVPKLMVLAYPKGVDLDSICRLGFEEIYPERKVARLLWERMERAYKELMTPAKGKRAEVIKGRKVAIGTTGEIIWLGSGAYGDRVGIKDEAGETHWTAASNIQVVPDPEEFIY